MFIYSKSSGLNNAAIGKLETPIKMIIEHESNRYSKNGGVCNWLYNVEKSNKYGETIVSSSDFDMFQATAEGAVGAIDTIEETYRKFIEHIQFTKEFSITAEMMEDANYGIAANAKHRAENFVRAYYKTINRICEHVLINGTKYSTEFAGADIDLITGDGSPLFSNKHSWGVSDNGGNQSNYFYGSLFSKDDDEILSTDVFEDSLYALAGKIRNMKDDNGDPMGYTADTIIIPGNNPKVESIVKKVCGSYGATGGNFNDINLHYGNWNVVVLPTWQPDDRRIMIMSSEANKNLAGNMFFNRVPLTVTNWIDNHTGNYIWNGRCRFGVGFGSYKHILLAVDSQDGVDNADYFSY